MACYKRIAEIWNISKTGHLHLCMGSNTNWPRVSEWSCTWLCFTWPVQKVNNNVHLCRSPSYRLWLWKYVASEPRSGDSPVRIMGAYPKALCSCKLTARKVHQVHLQIRPGAMKTFRPSSMRCCHPSSWYEDCFKPKALPVPDSTLQLCRSASGFSAPCRGSCYWETQARVTCGTVTLGSQLLTPFASFKGYGYASLVQAGWASLQVETRNLFCTWNKLKSPDKSSLAICHVESEAAWSKDPHKAEQTLQWKHQKNNDENDFESNLNTLQEKDEAGPKLARHHLETCKGSAYIARLRYWIFA